MSSLLIATLVESDESIVPYQPRARRSSKPRNSLANAFMMNASAANTTSLYTKSVTWQFTSSALGISFNTLG